MVDKLQIYTVEVADFQMPGIGIFYVNHHLPEVAIIK
jgi:hypothetical protein